MVDKFVTEKKIAQEYSVLTTHIVKTLQDRLRKKGLDQDRGKISPDNPASHNFEAFFDQKTGITIFEISFVDPFYEGEMRYVFKDGKVKKEGHTYRDDHGILQGEAYYGEYTQEDKDFIVGSDPDHPENLPRDDISFADPLPVDLEELRIVSQMIGLLGVDPKKAEKLEHELPWLE